MLTKEIAENWVNGIVELKKAKNSLYDALDTFGVEACCHEYEKEIHIFFGIERLAHALGVPVISYDATYDEIRGLASFKYKGIRFFEIWYKGGKNELRNHDGKAD